jgi:UDP-N-acetylglucosamine pyrophosphorylase
MKGHFPEFQSKMKQAGLSDAAIEAFKHNYETLVAGDTGMIPESSIQPVTELPRLEDISGQTTANPAYLAQTVVIKLNGGLGTSMGLERAKSLLPVKDGLTFLDFIIKQILHLREKFRTPLRLVLMNSFSTSDDTLEFLKKYPELGDPGSLELMQGQAPKVDAKTLAPISWPGNSQLEWCPPGHGDLYPSLLGSGWIDRLNKDGVKYLFVSNSDNLGATLDPGLLNYFAGSGKGFLMEVTERTASDRKGGHLAQKNGRLLLRELAQCPEQDNADFQNIQKHRFFNTNSLWIRLDKLKELLTRSGGFIPLPVIRNSKTVDPRDKNSPPVFQLETAMGAAIESFADAGAIVVPRSRFAPVKTTSDLLTLRSDAYAVTEDWRLTLATRIEGRPPEIDLDPAYYKLVDQLDDKLTEGVPSLKHCQELKVRGPVKFNSGNVFRGKVSVTNETKNPAALPAGDYVDCSKILNS